MGKLGVRCFSVSVDGFGAGPNQDLQNPLGVGGRALHEWAAPHFISSPEASTKRSYAPVRPPRVKTCGSAAALPRPAVPGSGARGRDPPRRRRPCLEPARAC